MLDDIELFKSAHGIPTARKGDYTLFSVYDPAKETERFVGLCLKNKKPNLVLVAGDGFGYLAKAAQSILPDAEVLSISYAADLKGTSFFLPSNCWWPGMGQSLTCFLEERLSGRQAFELEIIEWPACQKAFPQLAKNLKEELSRILRENMHSLIATLAQGRLWLRNALSNFLNLKKPQLTLGLNPKPLIVIAASGPSLCEAFPLLTRLRSKLSLWALPSSAMALRAAGLEPDLVVATDGSFWADSLLHFPFEPVKRLAMPLTASRAVGRRAEEVFVFIQPNFFEEDLAKKSRLPFFKLPGHGSVAGTALALALATSSVPIVFCGLDCCFRDIQAHIKPHPFLTRLEFTANRFSPFYSKVFRRALAQAPNYIYSLGIRTGPAHEVYAASFKGLPPGRVFRFAPSAQVVKGMAEIEEEDFYALAKRALKPEPKGPVLSQAHYPAYTTRQKIVKDLIKDYLGLVRDWEKNAKGLKPSSQRLLSELIRFLGGQSGVELWKRGVSFSPEEIGRLTREIQDFLQDLLAKFDLA